jgi:preprotein translocase subunit SecG
MLYVIITLIIIASVLLILVVMAQDSKGGGFVGSANPNQMMGVKKTTDLLEKLTWGFAIGIMVLAVASALTISGFDTEEEGGGSINVERARSMPANTPAPAPQTQSVGPAESTSGEATDSAK